MVVTATASTSVPKGSPTRCATTSAWWMEATTAANIIAVRQAPSARFSGRPQAAASTNKPKTGTTRHHSGSATGSLAKKDGGLVSGMG